MDREGGVLLALGGATDSVLGTLRSVKGLEGLLLGGAKRAGTSAGIGFVVMTGASSSQMDDHDGRWRWDNASQSPFGVAASTGMPGIRHVCSDVGPRVV